MVPGRHTAFSNNQNLVSILQKELECKVEKLGTYEVGGYAAEDQRQIPISRTRIDHIGSADIKC